MDVFVRACVCVSVCVCRRFGCVCVYECLATIFDNLNVINDDAFLFVYKV